MKLIELQEYRGEEDRSPHFIYINPMNITFIEQDIKCANIFFGSKKDGCIQIKESANDIYNKIKNLG